MHSLPTTDAALGRPDGHIDATSATQYQHVLIVEDEATLRRVVARNLTGRGLSVSEAESAAAAVGVVAQERPDLILLDINLPDRTGWDVLRELRRQDIEIPTIVISAVRANPSRLAEFHPLAYLPKPFPIEALLRLVFPPPLDRSPSEVSQSTDS
jgi:DNA-binding response OmpR family regulator